MYTTEEGETAPGPDEVKDEYPAVVKNADGHTVLIVQASAYIKYVGDITVYFDKEGNVANWTGKPYYLDSHVKPGDSGICNFFNQIFNSHFIPMWIQPISIHCRLSDEDVLKAIQPWKEVVDAKGQWIVGETKVQLQRTPCSMRECNLGNFVADAYVHYYIAELSGKNENAWDQSIISLVPYGSIRTTLNKGCKCWHLISQSMCYDLSVSFLFHSNNL